MKPEHPKTPPKRMMALPLIGAFLFGLATFLFTTLQVTRADRQMQAELINLTSSFVTAYAETQPNNGVVPAQFRRMALDRYNEQADRRGHNMAGPVAAGNATESARMVGNPGYEIGTVARSDRLKQMVAGFAQSDAPETQTELRLEDGALIGRTIKPSIASSQSCVDCHNAQLGSDVYQLGDVLGAFIVESDLTDSAKHNAFISVIFFVLVFVAALFMTRREQRRMSLIVDGLRARVRLDEVTAQARAQREFLLTHDNLTSLPNRSSFREYVEAELPNMQGNETALAVIELDQFNTINETMGYRVGDRLLIEIAQRLRAIVPQQKGMVARLAGDEFAVLTRLHPEFSTADDLGHTLSGAVLEPFDLDGYDIQPRCSIGLTIARMGDDLNSATLIREAQAAVQNVQTDDKTRHKLFDEDLRSSLGRQADIAARLPAAIKANEIHPVLQPKMCLAKGTVRGFEALARWQSNGENIAPDEFVQIAEKTGNVLDIDLSILRAAAEFSVALAAETGAAVPFSANLSAASFRAPDLAHDIISILAQTGMPPGQLTLEMTETTAVENWSLVESTLGDLRSIGVKMSLDDFGTGYSSLSYLRRFAFEEIKIDRAFITDIHEDTETRFLFESICSMAKGLGCSVVVEGIETENQAELVRQNGAQVGQGYLFAKPLSLPDARDYFIAKLADAA